MPQTFVTIVWGKENKTWEKSYLNAMSYRVPQEVKTVYFTTHYTTEEIIGIGMRKLFKIKKRGEEKTT